MEKMENNAGESLFCEQDVGGQDMRYDAALAVSYSTTAQYRAALRQIFNMEAADGGQQQQQQEQDDDEGGGESAYDEAMCCQMMDYIYSRTKQDEALMGLYSKAAATMNSRNREIGLVVLFSYDYFHLFHLVLCDFFREPAAAMPLTNFHFQHLFQALK